MNTDTNAKRESTSAQDGIFEVIHSIRGKLGKGIAAEAVNLVVQNIWAQI